MSMLQSAFRFEQPILNLKDTLEDATFRSLHTQPASYKGMMPGRVWEVQAIFHDTKGVFAGVKAYGPCLFKWACNRSGGTLAQGALAKWYSTTVTDIDSGAVGSITKAAEWTAGEQQHNLLFCSDDAGAAGAAPEGEMVYIVKNTANILYVQPEFTVAPAANDDFIIRSRTQIIASAIGDSRAECAGVVLAEDGIPDNYWGWICAKGIVWALQKAGTAIAADTTLIADTGRMTVSSTSDNGLSVAYSVVDLKVDSVSDLMPVEVDVDSVLAVTT